MRNRMRTEVDPCRPELADFAPCQTRDALEVPDAIADKSGWQKNGRGVAISAQDRKGACVEILKSIVERNDYRPFRSQLGAFCESHRIAQTDCLVIVFIKKS